MTELSTRRFRSVFAKQVLLMIVLSLLIMVLVSAFFWILNSDLSGSLDALQIEFAREAAASGQLDQPAAEQLRGRIGVRIRYEGPRGNWSTSQRIPSIADLRSGRQRMIGADYNIVPSSDGGAYLFVWTFGRQVHVVHRALITSILALFLATAGVIYLLQNRLLLRPLKTLQVGVAKVAAGDLEVHLPATTGDEFALLTGAFNAMVARVRDVVQAREQLLRDVSHELRSPLTRLKVALELLPPGNATARMAEDVREMEAMISELLEMERLRDGQGITRAPYDVALLVQQEVEALRGREPGARIAASPAHLLLDGDAGKVRLVVRNILENAVKFSGAAAQAVEASVEEQNEEAVLTFTDHGPGIPAADLPNIFEPFYRVDRSRSKASGGFGLGLSICKRIVEAHGGSIAAENRPTGGARFVVRLPRNRGR